jgi:hypothetical protein
MHIVKYLFLKLAPMARVIPGVEIKVVKEIVPQQLYPSGVVGMIGSADQGPVLKPTPVTSYRELTSIFGANPQSTLITDAKLAFLNGVFQVFATRITGTGGEVASCILKAIKRKDTVKLVSKVAGEGGNKIEVKVMRGKDESTVRIELSDGGTIESWDDLVMKKDTELYLPDFLNRNSKLVSAEDQGTALEFPDNNPIPQETKLEGGVSAPPTKADYEKALEMLEMEPEVDVVYACGIWDPEVHAVVDAHCKNMSTDAKNRIGIGTVAPDESVDDIIKRTEVLASDRFVLVAPYAARGGGTVAGAVAGLASKLSYWESPTFKALTGIADIERRYTPSEQMKLLTNGVLPVDAMRGRGIIVVKGITTSKEQISVMRVADHAVRGVKNIAALFIGTLNNARGRMALRERLAEFLLGMEKEGSIVPSVDETQPSYLVDVYSSQPDFAQGIVRVDIAVRPVRAMDYIYGTVTVQA